MSHTLTTTAWNINECKSFSLLFAYIFFVCVIFTYYSGGYIVHSLCSTRLPPNLLSQSFYNFHLFIIISQRRQKHFQFANDKWRWMLYWKYLIFLLSLYMIIIIIMTLICTSIQRCCCCRRLLFIWSNGIASIVENEKLLVNIQARLLIKRERNYRR